jgi:hypothetical protein
MLLHSILQEDMAKQPQKQLGDYEEPVQELQRALDDVLNLQLHHLQLHHLQAG